MRRPVWDYIIHIYPKQDLSIFAPFRVLFSIFALIFAPPQKFCKKNLRLLKNALYFQNFRGWGGEKNEKKIQGEFFTGDQRAIKGDHGAIIDRSIDRPKHYLLYRLLLRDNHMKMCSMVFYFFPNSRSQNPPSLHALPSAEILRVPKQQLMQKLKLLKRLHLMTYHVESR